MLGSLAELLDVQALSKDLVLYLPKFFSAVILLFVFWIGSKFVKKALSIALKSVKAPQEAIDIMAKFAAVALMTVGALTVAGQLGINVTSLVAGLGVAGLAISFAAQDTIANLISGMTLLIDRPFKKGDWISIGDTHCSVADIRLRTSVLTTFDNETIVMPNKAMVEQRIVNYTLTPRIRCRVPLGIAYKEDISAAREVMLGTLQGDERVEAAPAPMVIVTGLNASSVDLEMRFWADDPLLKFPMQFEYIEKCKSALDAAGIQIPYPHLQMFLEQTPGLKDLVDAVGAGQ